MDSTQILNLNNVKPNKLKLSDFDQGQTLGTGREIFKFFRVIWQSKNCKTKIVRKIFRYQNFKKSRDN